MGTQAKNRWTMQGPVLRRRRGGGRGREGQPGVGPQSLNQILGDANAAGRVSPWRSTRRQGLFRLGPRSQTVQASSLPGMLAAVAVSGKRPGGMGLRGLAVLQTSPWGSWGSWKS